MDHAEIIKKLNLIPHVEGGYFSETYRSDEEIPATSLPSRYKGGRCHGTCIYFLLTKDSFSSIHKIKSDEIFHFYLGDPVEMLQLFPNGNGKIIKIGNDLDDGLFPQAVVGKDVWQGARLIEGGEFALLGTTVSPGFDFKDFETGDRDTLLGRYPLFKDMIIKLTKEKK
jgi:predicted cupin superfamily sugar epimerase